MKLVDVQEAKAHFCEYLAAAEWCEEILIARHDEPVARLVAVAPREPRKRRPFGLAKGKGHVPDDINEPLDVELLGLFTGEKMLPSD